MHLKLHRKILNQSQINFIQKTILLILVENIVFADAVIPRYGNPRGDPGMHFDPTKNPTPQSDFFSEKNRVQLLLISVFFYRLAPADVPAGCRFADSTHHFSLVRCNAKN
jgi:hypothetical protein